MSITEAFCVDRLMQAAEADISPAPGTLTATIWSESAVEASKTRDSLKKAMKDWFGVKVDWEVVDGLAEVRNAVAHGLGVLTRQQQRRRQSTLTRIRRTSIAIEGDSVVLDEAALRSAVIQCRTLILAVDLSLP